MRLSLPLMVASLAVLGAFLLWFLQRSWKDEALALEREANLMLVSAVRSIEGAVFDRFIFKRMARGPGLEADLRHLPEMPGSDSTRVLAFFKDKTEVKMFDSVWQEEKKETVRKVNLRLTNSTPQTTGALSIIVNLEAGNKTDLDSSRIHLDSTVLFDRLQTAFRQQLEKSGLPLGFRLSQQPYDGNDAALGTASYVDLASQQRYDATFTDYHTYLLRRIWPQIAFALFLFSLVSLAFWLIYRSLQQQRRLTELKNDFIRNITHELKTPVSTVSVAVEALQNFGALSDPERAKEYLDISKAELNRLSLLVDRVLRMSLFEKTAPELKPERLDLKALVEEILSTMRLQFEKYQAKVQFHSSGSDFSMDGDRLHLAGVIYNLLDNALKYSPGTPQVELGLEHTNDHLLLSVQDRGQGIPNAYRDKIFDRFFRVPTGDVHNVKGHGLGLSYVAGVVRQHRGDIQVESREGGGTVFRVALPLH